MSKDHRATDVNGKLIVSRWGSRFLVCLLWSGLGLLDVAQAQVAEPPKPLHALIVGGGPDLEHNQVAIESK